MPASDTDRAGGEPSRLDRELDELLQELRVLLPGVTVLLGFMLTVTFNSGFDDVTGAERGVFVAAFLSTAASALLLIAPGVRHRARFRACDKEELVASANRISLAASILLALSLSMVSLLVVEHLYGWVPGFTAGITCLALALWFWFGWAIMRSQDQRS